ncbi:MAG: amino acid ABC transporter substrate-binding protein [Hahellaceae bacterium]|nr:amino acid ABC transporter substrate-binding protein [Hahellaceae bacterium]MCP5168916.1 amino acid ABC transporter substrate-binding protein [Hahellaceae bacterium]
MITPWRCRIFSSTLLCLLFQIATANPSCPKPLTAGWDIWPPYQFRDELGRLTGLDIDIINSIAASIGCEVRFVDMPWKRQVEEIKSGRLDLAAGASLTEERQHFAYYSQAYRQESMAVFVLKDRRPLYPYSKLEDLIGQPFRLGVTLGYYYGENFERLVARYDFSNQLESVPNDQLNYYKLLRSRIDGLLADPFTVASQLKQLQLNPMLAQSLFQLYSNDVHIIFSKASVHTQLVSEFNHGLQTIQGNGLYSSILQHYLQ